MISLLPIKFVWDLLGDTPKAAKLSLYPGVDLEGGCGGVRNSPKFIPIYNCSAILSNTWPRILNEENSNQIISKFETTMDE